LTIYGVWWLWNNNSTFRRFVSQHLETGTFPTLEARYTAEQIMEAHRKELLKNPQYNYLEPTLQFYPYALMEVKYSLDDATTSEGVILWGLEDGEMVVDTASWTKTHGLEDCINNRADRSDYRLVLTLARFAGAADRSKLLNALHVDNEALDAIVDSCRRKKLVVQNGNQYRLHFQRPLLQAIPETKLDQFLVTQAYKDASRVAARYSLSQIEEASNNLFVNDFSVRQISQIYLPVYCIVVQNPDGSLLTTYWNALNGKRFTNTLIPER
jgi:hypothetical protein